MGIRRASAPSTRRSRRELEWHRLAAARRASARLPRLHRQRPGDRHGHVRQRLPARPERPSPPTCSPGATPVGGRRPGVLRAERRCSSTSAASRSARRCPAYKHDAAHVPAPRGWIATRPRPHPRQPARARTPTGPCCARSPTASGVLRVRRLTDAAFPRCRSSRPPARLPRPSRPRSASSCPFDDAVEPAPAAPLAQAARPRLRPSIGNRFAILPMEGWDGTADGRPTDLTRRRWQRLRPQRRQAHLGRRGRRRAARRPRQPATSCHAPRANVADLAALRDDLVDAHRAALRPHRRPGGRPAAHALGPVRAAPRDRRRRAARSPTATRPRRAVRRRRRRPGPRPTTSSTRWSTTSSTPPARAPTGRLRLRRRQALPRLPRPRVALGASTGPAATAAASRTARGSSARSSPASAPRRPAWRVGVRLSAFDFVPFRPRARRRRRARADAGAVPLRLRRRRHRRRASTSTEPRRVPRPARRAGHRPGLHHRRQPVLQPAHPAPGRTSRPPTATCRPKTRWSASPARSRVTAELKRAAPEPGRRRLGLLVPAGLAAPRRPGGRPRRRASTSSASADGAVLPRPAADVLAGRPLDRDAICRTFSDCTTAPRNGLVSGCYPLDEAF